MTLDDSPKNLALNYILSLNRIKELENDLEISEGLLEMDEENLLELEMKRSAFYERMDADGYSPADCGVMEYIEDIAPDPESPFSIESLEKEIKEEKKEIEKMENLLGKYYDNMIEARIKFKIALRRSEEINRFFLESAVISMFTDEQYTDELGGKYKLAMASFSVKDKYGNESGDYVENLRLYYPFNRYNFDKRMVNIKGVILEEIETENYFGLELAATDIEFVS